MHVSKISLLLLSTVLVVDAARSKASSEVKIAAKHNTENVEHVSGGIDEEVMGNISTQRSQGLCTIKGDPHIRPFDGGHQMHPMHAPGHWWLVHGRDDFMSIQATYGGCGLKSGGWMSVRVGNVPRTCLTGIAIGGRLMQSAGGHQNLLVVRPPCEWDWDASRCTNTDTAARIKWNDGAVSELDVADPPVKLTQAGNKITVELNHNVKVELWTAGTWNNNPAQYMNAHILMDKPPAGSICGHCGNFNGDAGDDHMYETTGLLKAGITDPLCDPSVHCDDRLMHGVQFGSYTAKESYECQENKGGVAFTLDDCRPELLNHARAQCSAAFQPLMKYGLMKFLENEEYHELYDECLMDECTGGDFAKDDADDALHEMEDFKKR